MRRLSLVLLAVLVAAPAFSSETTQSVQTEMTDFYNLFKNFNGPNYWNGFKVTTTDTLRSLSVYDQQIANADANYNNAVAVAQAQYNLAVQNATGNRVTARANAQNALTAQLKTWKDRWAVGSEVCAKQPAGTTWRVWGAAGDHTRTSVDDLLSNGCLNP
jgi:hypothetical protein